MAYQFADGFDNYGNNYNMTAGYPWTAVNGFTPPFTSTADYCFAPPGSLPGGCLNLEYEAGTNSIGINMTSNLVTIIVGVAFKVPTLPAGSSIQSLITWYDNTGGSAQVTLGLNSTGQLQFYRGTSGGTAIGTLSASGSIAANAWYTIATSVTVDPSAGAVILYLNGAATPAINSTGLNTRNSSNTYANQILLNSTIANNGSVLKYDDFYCFDTTGSYQNSLPSSTLRVLTKMPSGAGTYTNWTPNGLAANYSNAAVQPPNTSDYNSNNTATTKDSYVTQSAGLTVAPYFVVARASMRRDDAGPHTPSIFVRSSSTDSSGIVTPALSSSYIFYDAIFQTDPATSAVWTGAGADAAQVGVIEG